MTCRHTAHVERVVKILSVVAVAAGAPGAAAQSRPSAAPPAKAASETVAWQDCSLAAGLAANDAIAKATELLSRLWLTTDRGYFAAYTMAGEVRNPFDLSPKQQDSGPRDGIVQTRPPRCTWRATEVPDELVVRFGTAFYRFYEAGHGWSAPLRDGLLLEARIERAGAAWQVHDATGEQGVLLPEQKPRAANASALPADAPWAEPMPGCARKTAWNGEACIARKR